MGLVKTRRLASMQKQQRAKAGAVKLLLTTMMAEKVSRRRPRENVIIDAMRSTSDAD